MSLEADRKIIKVLDEWDSKEDALPETLALYRGLLRVQCNASAQIKLPSFAQPEGFLRERLEKGSPLLNFEDLPVDWPLFDSLFEQIVSVLGEYRVSVCLPDDLDGTEALRRAVETWYRGGRPQSNGQERVALELAFQNALKPFMDVCSEALAGMVDQEQWRRRLCPVCGGRPDFAYLDKGQGARHLMCSRCDTEWIFQRTECPNCGTQDQTKLAYFTDDTMLYRLYVCDSCRSYLKAIDLRSTGKEVLLPLERLLTLDMDAQAHEKGYSLLAGVES